MEKKNYSDKLKNPKWQKKRLEVFDRDKFSCKLCGDKETTLNVHHKKYIQGREPWEYENSELITLCEDCHKVVSIVSQSPVNGEPIAAYKYKLNSMDGIAVVMSYRKFSFIFVFDKDGVFNQSIGFTSDHTKNIIKTISKTNGRLD